MKLLMCTGGGETSAATIRFGIMVAKPLQADISILYVQPRAPHAVQQEMRLAREKLKEWKLEVPGFAALNAAKALLLEEGFLKIAPNGEPVQKYPLKAGVRGAYEQVFSGARDENVRLRLREGDIIDEVNAEVESDQLDLVIMGASQKRQLLRKLVRFVDCSILIVKNPGKVKYEYLICTDGSAASRKAETFGIQMARMQNSSVLLLSLARSPDKELSAMEEAERASRSLARAGIRHSIAVRVGNLVDCISELAREDRFVILGATQISEIKKFLFGSIPMKIIDRVNCPVLIVQ